MKFLTTEELQNGITTKFILTLKSDRSLTDIEIEELRMNIFSTLRYEENLIGLLPEESETEILDILVEVHKESK